MSIAEIVLAVTLLVAIIALERLVARNRKEFQKFKRRLEKAGVIDIESED